MKKNFTAMALAMIVTSTATAETVFFCTVSTGKEVKVEYNPSNNIVTYSYGRNLKKPEIRLQSSVDKVIGDSRQHYGGIYINAIGIKNGKFTYIVTSGKGEEGHFSYLSVHKGKSLKEIANFECKNQAYSSLEDLMGLVHYEDNMF